MNIRTYKESDRKKCIEIFKKNIGTSFLPEDLPFFEHWLDNHFEYPYFIVEDGNVIVACGGIYFDERYQMAGLCWGMVDPSHQRKGIGRQFTHFRIDRIRDVFPQSGCFIETTQHAAAFYVKMGFRVSTFERNGFSRGNHRYRLEYKAA